MARRALPDDLSEREVEILRLIATNQGNRAIAARLYLSPNTVKTYIRVAYRKIGVTNRSGAVLWALEHASRAAPTPTRGRLLLWTTPHPGTSGPMRAHGAVA